ncbi:MAG TPA: glycosyltransferase family 39 protein [Chthoniobacteraceae bacterium]|nr:glycosyltransferase family 39 protein [Chthoniobacteraceae bacterium]
MTRSLSLLLLCCLWGLLYLPGLGGGELKGEEGRRILPGLEMLADGDWIVPHLNGEPYLRKPPLINWAVAGATVVTGQRTEWSVRLPSVLAVLAATLVLAWSGGRWIGQKGGFLAGLFFLTHLAMLEKGRLIEIEAIYVSLTAIAFALWLAAWMGRETGWRLWLVPMLALGLGILAKGPFPHLLFFYGLLFLVLAAAKEKRLFLSWAHAGALLLALALVCAWWLPYYFSTRSLGATTVMLDQLKERVGGGRLELVNIPRALANGLPWIVFYPLLWNRRVMDAISARNGRLALLVRTTRWPLVIAFAGLMVIPGMLPRYTLPLYPVMALLLALAALHAPAAWKNGWRRFNRGVGLLLLLAIPLLPWVVRPAAPAWWAWLAVALVWGGLLAALIREWRRPEEGPVRLALGTALCIVAAMIPFSLVVIERISLRDHLRPVGRKVAAEVPANQFISVIDPGYEASLFYIDRPLRFVSSVKEVPPDARFALVREREWRWLEERRGHPISALPLHQEGKKPFFLLKLDAESETTPRPTSRPK